MLIPRNILKLGKVAAQNDGIYNEKAIYLRRTDRHCEALIHNGHWIVTVRWLELEAGKMEDYPLLDVTPKMILEQTDGWVMLQAYVAVNALKAMGKPDKHMPILDCLYLEEVPSNGKDALRAFHTDLEQVGQYSSGQEGVQYVKGIVDFIEIAEHLFDTRESCATSAHFDPKYVALIAGIIQEVMPKTNKSLLFEPGIDKDHCCRISATHGGYMLTVYLMPRIS